MRSDTLDVMSYQFERRCYTPILPLVYSDALSYIETLAQFSEKLNEVIDSMNNLEADTLEQAKAYTDAKIVEQLEVIDRAVAEVNTIASQLRTENEQFKSTVNARVGIVEYNFEELKKKTEADYKAANNYTNIAIENNNDYLLSHLESELSKVKVLNYFTGERVSVQDMFDYLARFHLTNAISVDTLVARAKTVNQLIAYNMTMTDLATNGGTIIQA